MNLTKKICNQEQDRLSNLLEFLQGIHYDFEIEKLGPDFIDKNRCCCNNIESIKDTLVGIKYVQVDICCSILIIYSKNSRQEIYNIDIISDEISLETLSELMIEDEYNLYWHEKNPIIDLARLHDFLHYKVITESAQEGSVLNYVEYSIVKEKDNIIKQVRYYPYNETIQKNKMTTIIDLNEYAIQVFSNDNIELSNEYISKWLEVFYDEKDPRSITQMVGYFEFLEFFKNENVNWTEFLDSKNYCKRM